MASSMFPDFREFANFFCMAPRKLGLCCGATSDQLISKLGNPIVGNIEADEDHICYYGDLAFIISKGVIWNIVIYPGLTRPGEIDVPFGSFRYQISDFDPVNVMEMLGNLKIEYVKVDSADSDGTDVELRTVCGDQIFLFRPDVFATEDNGQTWSPPAKGDWSAKIFCRYV